MVHWTTVESGALAPGTPDVEGCWRGVSFWVECKWAPYWKSKVRPEQVGWHLRRKRAGGRSFILTRRVRDDEDYDELWLHGGENAAVLQEGGLKCVDPLLWCGGGPSTWDWDELLRCLAGNPGASRRPGPCSRRTA